MVAPPDVTDESVNPTEYAADDPEELPLLTVVTSNVFELELETIPLKLSAFAFLTITRSPLLLP